MEDLNNLVTLNEEEARFHLFTKTKYDLAIKMYFKLVQYTKQDKEKVVFQIGNEQRAYPASLVRMFTNIRTNLVKVSDKYHIQEVMNLFEIVLNLQNYKCEGVLRDYSDWKPIASFVNMAELAKLFGMEEICIYLKNLADLFTEHNKNALENEMKRREKQKLELVENKRATEKMETEDTSKHREEQEQRPSRSRKRSRSLTSFLRRSLSRSRKDKNQ
jgi:hypothetical protein